MGSTAQSRLRTLKQAQLSHLATLQRHWKLNVTALDDKIRTLSLRDFITLHAGDEQAALRAVVANELASAPMGAGEQGARIRSVTAHLANCFMYSSLTCPLLEQKASCAATISL